MELGSSQSVCVCHCPLTWISYSSFRFSSASSHCHRFRKTFSWWVHPSCGFSSALSLWLLVRRFKIWFRYGGICAFSPATVVSYFHWQEVDKLIHCGRSLLRLQWLKFPKLVPKKTCWKISLWNWDTPDKYGIHEPVIRKSLLLPDYECQHQK